MRACAVDCCVEVRKDVERGRKRGGRMWERGEKKGGEEMEGGSCVMSFMKIRLYDFGILLCVCFMRRDWTMGAYCCGILAAEPYIEILLQDPLRNRAWDSLWSPV